MYKTDTMSPQLHSIKYIVYIYIKEKKQHCGDAIAIATATCVLFRIPLNVGA